MQQPDVLGAYGAAVQLAAQSPTEKGGWLPSPFCILPHTYWNNTEKNNAFGERGTPYWASRGARAQKDRVQWVSGPLLSLIHI